MRQEIKIVRASELDKITGGYDIVGMRYDENVCYDECKKCCDECNGVILALNLN